LLRACPDLVEQHTTALLDMFDLIPLGPMMALANELRGIVHQGHALAGMIYMLARQRQGGAPRVDQRIRASEAAKGRSTGARLCKDRKLASASCSRPRRHCRMVVSEHGSKSRRACLVGRRCSVCRWHGRIRIVGRRHRARLETDGNQSRRTNVGRTMIACGKLSSAPHSSEAWNSPFWTRKACTHWFFLAKGL
jgi:hypothetical protein